MSWFFKNANIVPTFRCDLLMKQKIGRKETTFELFNNKYLRGVTPQEVLVTRHNPHLIVHISRLCPLVLVSLPLIIVGRRRSSLLRADHFGLDLSLIIELMMSE